jgi:ketosteroid isomerase-like protein
MNVETEILAFSAEWDAVLVTNDAEGVASFMADDWVYVAHDGITTKVDLIGWIASGRLAHHSMETVGTPRIAVHGDTVIVSARKASTGTWEGAAYRADEWISEVFVRQDGSWRSVLSHKCPTT